MATPTAEHDLWALVQSGQPIDFPALASALESRLAAPEPINFRTRLLIRDSLGALAKRWGADRLENWMDASPGGVGLRQIWKADLGEVGFPSLATRIMETTKADTVMQFLREMGLRCPQATRIEIGGSIALILANVLNRATEDLDVVDEVPASLRSQHDLLRELANRFGLHLTHFQSHYLPEGWKNRLHSLGRFGQLDIFLVDALDVLVGKLFSARTKDRDDLRALAAHFDRKVIEERLRSSGTKLRSDPALAQMAQDNWYILYGQPLPE